ncbi:hypothetical protein VSDKYIMU_CDS0014 [Enterococcus phage VRE9_4]
MKDLVFLLGLFFVSNSYFLLLIKTYEKKERNIL